MLSSALFHLFFTSPWFWRQSNVCLASKAGDSDHRHNDVSSTSHVRRKLPPKGGGGGGGGGCANENESCKNTACCTGLVCTGKGNSKACTPNNPPTTTTTTTPTTTPTSPSPGTTYCGCPDCTQSIWDAPATDGAGTFSCGSRITWLQSADGGSLSEYDACVRVGGSEFPCGPCGPMCDPSTCNLPPNPVFLNDTDPANLIWSDEFDADGSPDPSKWTYDLGDGCSQQICGWGNNELQDYTDSLENVAISDGILSITARKEQVNGPDQYTSTRMVSRGLGDFRYGRILVNATLEDCTAIGTWPAIWMLPTNSTYGGWPDSGEIDIMEHVGYDNGKFHGTVHTKAYNHAMRTQKGGSMCNSISDWHVFEINWEVDRIQFAIDKEVYFEFNKDSNATFSEWPFDQDFHILMNIAVGGNWGGAQGVDSTAFEGAGQIMKVDWVRVYSS